MYSSKPFRLIVLLVLCLWALPAFAANKFWTNNVGGANNHPNCTNGIYLWDADSGSGGAAHSCWATATGGGTGTTIPGTGDVAIFDANSGTNSVLVNAPNNALNINGVTTTAYAGTLDFGNGGGPTNNVTMGGNAFFGGGTINLGTGTWLINGASSTFTVNASATACTCSNATLTYSVTTATGAAAQLVGGLTGLTFGTVNFTDAGTGGAGLNINDTATFTINTLVLNGPANVTGTSNGTLNIGTTLTVNGSAGNYVNIYPASNTNKTVFHYAGAPSATINGAAMSRLSFTCGSAGTITATASIDLKANTATTCTLSIVAPATGSGGFIIGG